MFLPDGQHYLYSITSSDPNVTGIYLGALDSKEIVRLAGDPSSAGYAPGPSGDGYLLFVREEALIAQPLDPSNRTVSGDAFPVAEKVGFDTRNARANFSVSANGMLVVDSSGGDQRQLIWMDRVGNRLGNVGEPGSVAYPALSPDEKQMAFLVADASSDIWLQDLARGISTRFTFHPGRNGWPVWSSDGSRIAFSSDRDGVMNLYQKSASGARQEQLLLESAGFKFPTDWSPDGGSLLYHELDPKTGSDLWVLPLAEGGKPALFLQTEFAEREGAYSSDESGRVEIYVQPYPATGAKWQVSKGGGHWPCWRRDGKEMFFLEMDGTMMAVEVSGARTFQAGIPTPLFETDIIDPFERYSVSRDGKRLLVAAPVDETAASSPTTLIQNWLAGTRK